MRGIRSFKKIRLIIIFLAAILLIGVTGFFGFKIFTENKLTKFQIEMNNVNCTTVGEVSNFLGSLHLNYFYFKKEIVDSKLSQRFLCIGKIESEVSYPDKLRLNLSGREGKFVVTGIKTPTQTNPTIVLTLDQLNATQSTTEAFPPKILNQILKTYQDSSPSAMFLADDQGMIFQEASSDVGFPKLSIFEANLKIGQKLEDDLVKKALEINDKLKNLDEFTGNFIIVGDRLIADSKPRVTFSLNRPIDRQSASLQLIVAQAKMNLDPDSRDTRSVESVDLRFDRPVVVYSKK